LNWPAVTVPVSRGDRYCVSFDHVSVMASVDGFPFAHLIVPVPLVVFGNPLNPTILQFNIVGDVTVNAMLPRSPAGPVHVARVEPGIVVIFSGTRRLLVAGGRGGLKDTMLSSCLHVSPAVAPPDGAPRATSPIDIVTTATTATVILRSIRILSETAVCGEMQDAHRVLP
jgi:hypothetical protein